MKQFHKSVLAICISTLAHSAQAASINSVLDGMFTNVTSPDVVSTQFRGAVTGGSVYVRTPISNIQPFAIDPPRISAGCGGIDLYLGSFSFITAEKLTQFLRDVAQNAAPLAFKMALNASFPQLGGVLDKFQTMAQDMNSMQKSSCEMAQGLVDASKNPAESLNRLVDSTNSAIGVAKGWAENFFSSVTSTQTDASTNATKTQNLNNADGTKAEPAQGNITWNALGVTRPSSFVINITDDATMSKQLVLSMIGTTVMGKPSATGTAQTVSPQYPARLRLKQLIEPSADSTGSISVPIYSCGSDTSRCLTISPASFATYGVSGFVRSNMLGSTTATTPQTGSITQKLISCSTASCSLTSGQLAFLNALGKIPVVGLLKHAQKQSSIFSMIAPTLIDDMVTEVGSLYGRAVLDLVISTYSGTNIPKPDGYDQALKSILDDLMDYEKKSKTNIERLNAQMAYIDSALKSFQPAMVYRR